MISCQSAQSFLKGARQADGEREYAQLDFNTIKGDGN